MREQSHLSPSLACCSRSSASFFDVSAAAAILAAVVFSSASSKSSSAWSRMKSRSILLLRSLRTRALPPVTSWNQLVANGGAGGR